MGVIGAAGKAVFGAAVFFAAAAAPGALPAGKGGAALFDSVGGFVGAFNKAASRVGFGFRLGEPEVGEGGRFQHSFGYIYMWGAVDAESLGVTELTMIGATDGTLATAADLTLCMAVIIAIADPSLPPGGRGGILRELGFLGSGRERFGSLQAKTVKNGVEYFIDTSLGAGLMFGVSRK
jgi:hypothetical protein